MHELIHHRTWKPVVWASLLTLVCAGANAEGPAAKPSSPREPFLSMDSWQEPIAFSPRVEAASLQDTNAVPAPPGAREGILSPNPAPEATFPVPPSAPLMLSPDGYCDPNGNIELHDGGSPDDWSWGCGGSPYRTGPGFCDNWKVGCRWESTFEGSVLVRPRTSLSALNAATSFDLAGAPLAGAAAVPDVIDNFDIATGGRISFVGYMPRWNNYNVQAAYEGWNDWDASIVYPKFTPESAPLAGVVGPAGSFEQRTVYYRSTLNSAELNIVRLCHPVWRPYFGVRYVRFDDQIRDTINQEIPNPPLPSTPSTTTFATDMSNLFELENQMIGFQVGVRRDIWRLGRWFSVEGYADTGVYHNLVKRTHLMQTSTLELVSENPATTALENGSVGTSTTNNDVSNLNEISYLSEASLSVVCRLNRCCALTGGYQALWIQNLHLADDEFVNNDSLTRGLFFQGWHAGFEYRR